MRNNMSPCRRYALLAVAIMVVAGTTACTSRVPYRKPSIVLSQSNGVTLDEKKCHSGWRLADRRADSAPALPPCEPDGGGKRPSDETLAMGKSSIQHRHYMYKAQVDETGEPEGTPTLAGDYHLAFVEFDDQGWFHDTSRLQMEALFMLLRRIEDRAASPDDSHVLIFVYVHGWKHNASQCDSNVICFARMLERMDILERSLRTGAEPRRQVVGVYVGWRGLSLDAGLLTNLTFWTRKGAAERVGRGGVRELFARLNEYRRGRNPCRDEEKTQLVVNGHSFGGLVVYSAVAHALMERAGRMQEPEARTEGTARCSSDTAERESTRPPDAAERESTRAARYSTATSFGDLVVLVNPAFQGSLYEPLFHMATNRCYGAVQRPVMLTVTSRTDDATGIAFPIGRWFNALFQRSTSPGQHDSIRLAIGHDGRYKTHSLKWTGTAADARQERKQAREEEDCGCPHLDPTNSFAWWTFIAPTIVDSQPGTPVTAAEIDDEGRRVYPVYGKNVSLVEGETRYSANYPYLVVEADRQIIKDHNDIYSEPFMRFLHSFFLIHIATRHPFEVTTCFPLIDACQPNNVIPCEESCRRFPSGESCTGRSTKSLQRVP